MKWDTEQQFGSARSCFRRRFFGFGRGSVGGGNADGQAWFGEAVGRHGTDGRMVRVGPVLVARCWLLTASMLLGGSHIDHVGRLRAGSTQQVLPFLGDGFFHPGNVSFVRSRGVTYARWTKPWKKPCRESGWVTGRADRSPVGLDVDSTIS